MSHANFHARVGRSGLAASLVLLIVGSTTPLCVTSAQMAAGGAGIATRPTDEGDVGASLLTKLPSIGPADTSFSAMPAAPEAFHRAETMKIRQAERAAEISRQLEESRDPSLPELGSTEPMNYKGQSVFAANVQYFEDFEGDEAGREWSGMPLTAMEGFSRFAGPFRNSESSLSVKVNPGQPYIVRFDLNFIAATLGSESASDAFQIVVDGETLLDTTIAQLRSENEAANGTRPDFSPDIYRELTVPFEPLYDIAEIRFVCKAAGTPGGETWGLDNVMVDTAPDPTMGAVGGGGFRDIQAMGMGLDSGGGSNGYRGGGGWEPSGSSQGGQSDGPRDRRNRPPTDTEPTDDDEPNPPEEPPSNPPNDPPPDGPNPPPGDPPPPPPPPPPENPPPPPPPPYEPPPPPPPNLPAPGTVMMFGLAGLAAARRRRES